MTRWFTWFKEEGRAPYFKLVIAETIEVAEMMGNDLASRNKIKVIGVNVASDQFNLTEK